MDPTVRAVLARALPGATVESVTPATAGNSKRTAFVTLADGREVVVQTRPLAAGGLATETALSGAVARLTDVPVPRVLASGELAGHSYAVSGTVAGEDLHARFVSLPAVDRERLARTFGRHLAALHGAFEFEGYGSLGPRESGRTLAVTDPTTDWRTWFDGYLERGLDALGPELADLAPAIREAVDPGSLPARPPSRLYPWDLRPGNAVVAGDPPEAVALLDWGDPLAAAPGLSLAKTEYLVADWYLPADRERLGEAFRAGYRERRSLPAVPRAYRLAAVVHTAYDSRGRVTTPGYPEVDPDEAAAFHRRSLRALLDGDE